MKKLLSLALAAALGLTLAACSSGTATVPNTSTAPTENSTAPAGDTATGSGVEDGVLTVGMECAYAPYNWTQMDDSNGAVPIKNVPGAYANGYDVMIAQKICEENGWELEVVSTAWDSLTPSLQSGTIDVAIAGQSMTADRMAEVDMAGPYYYAQIVCLTTKDSAYAAATSIADLAGGTCTSQLNTIWYDNCLPQIPDANILPGQESAPAMIVALTSGRVDYIVTDQPTGLAAVAANPGLKLLDFTGTDGAFEVSDEDINIGISVQKGNTELLDAINGVLATLTEEDYTNMMNEAISVQPLSE